MMVIDVAQNKIFFKEQWLLKIFWVKLDCLTLLLFLNLKNFRIYFRSQFSILRGHSHLCGWGEDGQIKSVFFVIPIIILFEFNNA